MSARPLALLALGLFACSSPAAPAGPVGPAGPSGPPCSEGRFAASRFSVQCQRLVDAQGRVVFLHGVNARVNGVFDVTFDDGREALEPIPDFKAEDAARMRAIGFNALRLPINWSGLEPTESGGFDEGYLDAVASAVATAKEAGLVVLIDFHQDAYSKEIGEDGAPLWAIAPPPAKLLGGPLTDLGARRTSAQVLKAFSTFFGPSSEGAALRARFSAAVTHVAKRFAGEQAVIGIELYNEPLPDEDAELDTFHDGLITAIRAVDPGRIAFFEPNVTRNFFDHAPSASRAPWPGTAYSPHVYTYSFTGTDAQRKAMTRAKLEPSNKNAASEARSWKAPLVITEFGYGPADIQSDAYLAWQGELQDQFQASAFFWVWKEESQGSWGLFDYDATKDTWTERDHVRKALSRVVPEAVAGWPTSFGYDRSTKRFELKFTGDPAITAPSRIFVPDPADFADSFELQCDGKSIEAARDKATGIVEVACGGAGSHTLVVTGH
ncbi:MAG: cellulase family glycosylhydrolase [Minicystis sp.]